jgi:hypothetical protein
MNQGSSVLQFWATGWMIRVRIPPGNGNYYLHHSLQNGSGPIQPLIQWVLGALSVPPPSSAKIKNAWNYISTPQYVFIMWCLVKHKDNCTFTFTFTFTLLEGFVTVTYRFMKIIFCNPKCILRYLYSWIYI